jgi:hypothetical protein
MPDQEGVRTQGIGEYGAPGLVIDLARGLGETAIVIEPVTCIAILAVGAAVVPFDYEIEIRASFPQLPVQSAALLLRVPDVGGGTPGVTTSR